MSQQMHYDEAGRQYPANEGYESGYQAPAQGYRDPFAAPPAGQKLSYADMQLRSDTRASARQRLALAIVSIVMLVPISGVIFGTSIGATGGSFFALTGALIALGIICLTIMVVNFLFSRGH